MARRYRSRDGSPAVRTASMTIMLPKGSGRWEIAAAQNTPTGGPDTRSASQRNSITAERQLSTRRRHYAQGGSDTKQPSPQLRLTCGTVMIGLRSGGVPRYYFHLFNDLTTM